MVLDSKVPKKKVKYGEPESHKHNLSYASRTHNDPENLTKFVLPKKSSQPETAYRIVHDEMEMDDKPIMNCATFLTTWMEPEADLLIKENLAKNFVDQEGFPASQKVHERCVSMISHLWNIPDNEKAVGNVCGGSSEGVMLGGLAMKWKWKEKMQGKDTSKPNVVFGTNVHCCVEKFARYFDVGARMIPIKEEANYVLDPKDVAEQIDENTIGIISVFGSTYTGHFEPIKELSDVLDKVQKEKGYDVPIHVDAASGGFIAPFSFPDLKWGFDVKRVVSINASGHKYGLVYPGVGWVLWRNKDYLPKDLVFELHYLGTTEYSYTLNFSRPSSTIVAQYYNFIRLGFEGYKKIIDKCLKNARNLSDMLENSGYFQILSGVHKNNSTKKNSKAFAPGLPLVAFELSDETKEKCPGVVVDDVAHIVQLERWLIPAYNMPKSCEDRKILRIVIKESTSGEIVEELAKNLILAVESLIKTKSTISDTCLDFKSSLNPTKETNVIYAKTCTFARPC